MINPNMLKLARWSLLIVALFGVAFNMTVNAEDEVGECPAWAFVKQEPRSRAEIPNGVFSVKSPVAFGSGPYNVSLSFTSPCTEVLVPVYEDGGEFNLNHRGLIVELIDAFEDEDAGQDVWIWSVKWANGAAFSQPLSATVNTKGDKNYGIAPMAVVEEYYFTRVKGTISMVETSTDRQWIQTLDLKNNSIDLSGVYDGLTQVRYSEADALHYLVAGDTYRGEAKISSDDAGVDAFDICGNAVVYQKDGIVLMSYLAWSLGEGHSPMWLPTGSCLTAVFVNAEGNVAVQSAQEYEASLYLDWPYTQPIVGLDVNQFGDLLLVAENNQIFLYRADAQELVLFSTGNLAIWSPTGEEAAVIEKGVFRILSVADKEQLYYWEYPELFDHVTNMDWSR